MITETRKCAIALVVVVCAGITVSSAPAGVTISPSAGYKITWDGNDGDFFSAAANAPVPTNLASSFGTQIQSSFLAAGNHAEPNNVVDGEYGNDQSWISNNGDPLPYVGVNLNGTYDLTSIAWGRDNGDDVEAATSFTDRNLGVYTVQITNELDPATATSWTTIGTLNYVSSDDGVVGGGFTGYYRHEYDISANGGAPLLATGVRLLVPAAGIGGGTAIDEIELYGASPVTTSGLVSWERADGDVQTSGSTLTQWSDHSGNGNHITPTGSPPDLVAGSINGLPAIEFSSSIEHANTPVLDTELKDSDYEMFVVARTSDAAIQFITAAGGGSGVGEYELHLNGAAGARFIPSQVNATTDASHPDTFADLGVAGMFSDGRAHLFNTRVEGDEGFLRVVGMENGDTVLTARSSFMVDPRLTFGVRGNGTLGFVGEMGEVLIYDRALTETERREVERYLARKWNAPLNVASQTQGGVAFANEDFGGAVHEIDHLNNALYGNSESWLGNANGGGGAYAGVKFDDSYDISSLAMGRDATGGLSDRSAGTYTFQFTRDDFDPTSLASVASATWETFLVTSDPGPLRSVFDFALIQNVMGVRVLVSDNNIAIDELEIYGLATIPEPTGGLMLLGLVGAMGLRRRRG